MAFLAFASRLMLGWRGGRSASVLLAVALASTAWASCVVGALAYGSGLLWWAARWLDGARLVVWFGFLWVLLDGGRDPRRWFYALAAGFVLAGTLLVQAPAGASGGFVGSFAALLAASVCGLALVEQLYRRTPDNRRWAIKPLVIGLGGMFVFDLVMYSDAMLFRYLDAEMWAARGIAAALVMVFVAVATARNTAWTIDLHVSRGVVFHSTAVVAAGAYLVLVAAAAYWARLFGGTWGQIVAITFVFAALLALVVLTLSGSLRARLNVFVSKHFFSYRYDWRREWLQFTQMLGTAADRQRLYQQVLQAMANLVESVGGSLWIQHGGSFRQVAHLNFARVDETEPESSPLAGFLRRTGWVIRLDEVASAAERYQGLVLPAWLVAARSAWLVVPLGSAAELIGFVVLARPRAATDVNWEVLDLLKTASRQAASFLAQMRASEALLEAEKFTAFNRMSAFVVHDLKNLVAQLALLLKNAERHRDNREFQDDMLGTVEHVVSRMNRLMLQLRDGTTPPDHAGPVELRAVLERIVKAYENERVPVELELGPALRIVAHDDRIERVVGHLVKNGLEATASAAAGRVTLRAYRDADQAVLEVTDNGVGMTEQFVRERLFRPFQTTKAQGMGIGMNESFQYLSGIGGAIAVESAPGRGTTFRVRLPLATPDAAGEALGRAA